MNTTDNLSSIDFAEKKLPSSLNVLTILTFIGSAIQIIMGIYQFMTSPATYQNKDKVLAQMTDPAMPNFAKKMIGTPEEFLQMVTKNFENRTPILLLTLVTAALCIYGAMQMREQKKQGYPIYVAGEVLALFISILFVGTFIASSWGFIFAVVMVALFVLLYTLNRKHLIY